MTCKKGEEAHDVDVSKTRLPRLTKFEIGKRAREGRKKVIRVFSVPAYKLFLFFIALCAFPKEEWGDKFEAGGICEIE